MEVEDFDSNGDTNLNVEDNKTKRCRSMKNDDIVIGSGSSRTQFGRQWQNSSRIIRVSRASGGKDRHSKVWTAKGARDRRVRLSVNTAIQFYDLQDRLGYDQPSKAVEWLIKAAQDSINDLPSLDSSNFPPDDTNAGIMMLQGTTCVDSKTKSGCSSNNSENSGNNNNNNGLSLSRNEIRVKARERARERTAKEKDGGGGSGEVTLAARVSSHVGSSSFTQLLTAGINDVKESNNSNNARCTMSSSMSDYFGNGPLPNVMALLPFSGSSHGIHQHEHQQQQQHQQHLAFLVDNNHQSLVHVPNATTIVGTNNNNGGSDYNLNFSMSSNSTTSGFNRGTLQSNSSSSPSFLSYLQRFSANEGGSSVPFFLGGAPIVEHHHHQHQHYDHHHQQQFNPAGLHLSYGDGGRHSDDKGKGKN